MPTLILPHPGEAAYTLVTPPDAGRVCGGCGTVHCIVVARYLAVPGTVVPVITYRCIECDHAETQAPA
jgi:hypothetical protein